MSGKVATSDSRDSGKQQLDRENYPYFTDEQFITFIEDGMDLQKADLSCKRLYYQKINNYSLHLKKASHFENDLKIVLYGKTGGGKSSTANTILGQEEFKANRSSNSVTDVSLDNTCTYKNRRITVVDTPGIHDTRRDNATVMKELKRIAFLLKDGVHCFIICMSASDTRSTKDVIEMLQLIKQEGQGNFFDYCMLAYTRAETELKTCTLREFLEQQKDHKDMCCFLKKIKDRAVAVNNKCLLPAEALRNRDALIEMVDVVVEINRENGKPVIFSNDLFKKAGTLHVKLASVVQKNAFLPILVNATIEAIVNDCSHELTFDVFLNEVKNILTMRKKSEVNNKIPDLIIPETTRVNERYSNQVKQIYDEINKEVNELKESIRRIVLAVEAVRKTATAAVATTAKGAAVVTAVAGGATTVVAAATGSTAVGAAATGATVALGAAAVGATTVAAVAVAGAVGTAVAVGAGVTVAAGVLLKTLFK